MTNNRIFFDEQLDILGTPLSIRLERASKNKDPQEVERVRILMDQECTVIYNSYSTWIGVLQTFIIDHVGEDGHNEALRFAAEYAFRPFVREFKDLDMRGRAEKLARLLRASGSTFSVSADEDKVHFEVEVWGGVSRHWRSGAGDQAAREIKRRGHQYIYPSIGTYDLPASFVELSKLGPLNHGMENVPCLFAIEILLLEIMAIEEFGMPIAGITLPISPEASAGLDIYKDISLVPEEVFEKVAMPKPKHSDFSKEGTKFDAHELQRLATPLSIQVETAMSRDTRRADS